MTREWQVAAVLYLTFVGVALAFVHFLNVPCKVGFDL